MSGRTQDECSRLTGIDRSDLSGYANGRKPDYVNLIRFCEGLDASPTWLYFGVGYRSLAMVRERHERREIIQVTAKKDRR